MTREQKALTEHQEDQIYREHHMRYAPNAVGRGTFCPLASSSCLMNRGLGGYSFHHSELGVFTNMLVKHSKRHNMQGENLIPVIYIYIIIIHRWILYVYICSVVIRIRWSLYIICIIIIHRWILYICLYMFCGYTYDDLCLRTHVDALYDYSWSDSSSDGFI